MNPSDMRAASEVVGNDDRDLSTDNHDRDDLGAPSHSKPVNDENSASENFLLFGAAPSQLFDDIAVTLDALLAEQVSTLPLLPRTTSELDVESVAGGKGRTQEARKPLTGEEKLIAKLRKVYKKNIDLVEAYCSRNIFTIDYYPKTKRRKILEHFLAQSNDGGIEKGRQSEADDEANNDEALEFTALPPKYFSPPPPDCELPTPDQIIAMDKEILLTRQQLQQEKKRRIKLSRRLDQLAKASRSLRGVLDALAKGLGGKDGDTANMIVEFQASIKNAMHGHDELKTWNARAMEVIQLLDEIKAERKGGTGGQESGSNLDGRNWRKVMSREEDERERRKMWKEVNGVASVAGSHGTKEDMLSFLKKLKGN